MKMIEAKQIQLLHVQKSQLGLSDDEYRAAISGQTKGKKSSSKELTYFEADGLITYFSTLGAKIRSNYIKTSGAERRVRWQPANDRRSLHKGQNHPQSPFFKGGGERPLNVVMMPSRAQLSMIDVLVKKIAWSVEDGYELWRRKYMKIARITTAQQASDIIEGLKKLLDHQN